MRETLRVQEEKMGIVKEENRRLSEKRERETRREEIREEQSVPVGVFDSI